MARRKVDFGGLIKNIEEKKQGGGYSTDPWDENLWTPTLDAKGNSTAIIRFLPPKDGETMPYIELARHFVKGSNGYVVSHCSSRTPAKGEKCPLCEARGKLWEGDRKMADFLKAKSKFYGNILVVKNPNKPEEEGKVFKFQFNAKIRDLIEEKLDPQNPEIEDRVIIFDYDAGADFVVKAKQTSFNNGKKDIQYNSFDASSFKNPSAISLNGEPMTDEQIDKIIEPNIYSLNELVDDKYFKSYDALKAMGTEKLGIRFEQAFKDIPSGDILESDSEDVDSLFSMDTEEKTSAPKAESEDEEDNFFDQFEE